MKNKGLLQKIDFLLSVAQKQEYSDKELSQIVELSKEHSDHMILGRFMGYSVSDYAIATLKWLGYGEAIDKFNTLYNTLSQTRKQDITRLIDKKVYLQY